MEKNRLTVTILGVSLTIKSEESPEYLQKLTHFFQDKIDEAQKHMTTTDPLKILIMAGLNVSDELLKKRTFQVEPDNTELNPTDLEDFTARMINKIDKSLFEE